MSIRKNSGPTTAQAFRAAPLPVQAPSEGIARAVWSMIAPCLIDVTGHRPGRIEDVAGSVLKRVTPAERPCVELVAMQALTVAVDTAVRAGHEGQALFINDVFTALAARWSRRFRRTPGRSIWSGEKKAETLIDARRELLQAGVDLDRLWTAVCGGIDGLYRVRRIGGAGHTLGRRVELVKGEVLDAYERIVAGWRRAAGSNRILLADAPMPPLKIAGWTVAERDYDVMNVGEPTKEVIKILESARLFLVVGEVKKDVARLRELERHHAWPKKLAAWRHAWSGAGTDAETTKARNKDRKKLFRDNRVLIDEYNSLLGRLQQAKAVERQIELHRDRVDGNGHLEIKTGYYKTRNRRFQPRHFWPTEVSSKEDLEQAVVPNAEVTWDDILENDVYQFETEAEAIDFVQKNPTWGRIENEVYWERPTQFKATTSPRGRWFKVRAQWPDEQRYWDTDEKSQEGYPITWHDDFKGPIRPLRGVDASGSMFAIAAVALGWRDAEEVCERCDIKTLMAEGVLELVAKGKIHALDATLKQLRRGMGVVGNHAYGQTLGSIVRKLRSDTGLYGTGWGDSKNLAALLHTGREINKAIDLILRMREEYLTVAHELVDAAQARDAYAGLGILDPFDGTCARWHQPITREHILRNGAVSLLTRVPVGKPNAEGYFPANYKGRTITCSGGRSRQVDMKGSVYNLAVPGLIHALDAAYLGHVVTMLREKGVRDAIVVHDCFLVPSDAWPILSNTLEDATRPWFEGLAPFYKTFEQLVNHPVVRRWREAWERRLADCRAGEAPWPRFRFKPETTVALGA